MKNFKIEVLKFENNFEEGTRSWHQMCDILSETSEKSPFVELIQICYTQDIGPKYYRDIDELERDGLIKIHYEK